MTFLHKWTVLIVYVHSVWFIADLHYQVASYLMGIESF